MMSTMELFVVTVCVCLLAAVSATELRHHHGKDGEHDDAFDHDAILGSHKEEDIFAHLTPEEATARLEKILDKIDTNNDKLISREEIAHHVMHSFYTLRVEEIENRIKQRDLNGDGRITWEELLQSEYDFTVKQLAAEMKDVHSLSPTRKSDLEIIKHTASKFQEADHNHDKSLDKAEYHAMIYPMDSEVEHERAVDETLQKYDTNHDGSISYAEYRGTGNATAEEVQTMYEEFHHDYDSNRDGKIDRSEIRDWVMPGDKPAAESEADHLIAETDANGDKKLTYKEIDDKHKLWVGSMATEHGAHLHDSGEL